MNKFKQITLITCSLMLLQACSVQKKSTTTHSIIKTSSTATIMQSNEAQYETLYSAYRNKSGAEDAKTALKSGVKKVKVFYAGRGGIVIPAFDSAPKNCQQESVKGMGDVIYGENHIKYRKLMRSYVKDYNKVMLAYCQ